jgi:DNA repair protein RecO (recombination protein O)
VGIYKTKGIIIKRSDFGEADKFITIFTDTEGKIKTKAKGIRWILSKNKGHLELFTYSDLLIAEGREIDTVASATTIESFKNIKSDLKKTALAYYFCELVDKLTPEKDKNVKIFDLLLQSLRFLDKDGNREILSRYFELNFLSHLGYKPELSLCVHCRKPLQPIVNSFSCRLGGSICPSCAIKFDPRSIKISKDGIKVLRSIISFPLETVVRLKINSPILEEIKIVSLKFLRYVAERDFKSPKFLKELDELFEVA